MYDAKIDNDKPGKQGFVMKRLKKRNVRLPLPMKIHDVGHLNYNSIQRYLEWFVEPKHAQSCQVLSSSS